MKNRMAFTGSTLARLREALALAVAHIDERIDAFPDSRAYDDQAEVLQDEQAAYQKIIERIDRQEG